MIFVASVSLRSLFDRNISCWWKNTIARHHKYLISDKSVYYIWQKWAVIMPQKFEPIFDGWTEDVWTDLRKTSLRQNNNANVCRVDYFVFIWIIATVFIQVISFSWSTIPMSLITYSYFFVARQHKFLVLEIELSYFLRIPTLIFRELSHRFHWFVQRERSRRNRFKLDPNLINCLGKISFTLLISQTSRVYLAAWQLWDKIMFVFNIVGFKKSQTEITYLLEAFESSKFLSLIGEDTNWFFPMNQLNLR